MSKKSDRRLPILNKFVNCIALIIFIACVICLYLFGTNKDKGEYESVQDEVIEMEFSDESAEETKESIAQTPTEETKDIQDTEDAKNKEQKFSELNRQIKENARKIIDWKKSTRGQTREENLFIYPFVENAGNALGDWYALGIGRFGYPDNYNAYLSCIADSVSLQYAGEDKLDSDKATEWHRIALAILSMGGDPTSIGQGVDGGTINLIQDGVYSRGYVESLGKQGVNGWIWGLITLDSMRYIVPEDSYDNRDSIITEILKQQLKDGGFALSGESSDVDMTAMAIQALAPYYNSSQEYTYSLQETGKTMTCTVREVVDTALDWLSKQQLKDGDYSSMGIKNVESTAQVMVALCALGIDPMIDKRFIKNGNTVLDGIYKYQLENGGFTHSFEKASENKTAIPGEANSMASEQVLYSLNALYRFKNGMRSLYDFRESMSDEVKTQIQSLMQGIGQLEKEEQKHIEKKVKELYQEYLEIPASERSYVYNYWILSDYMKDFKIKDTSEYLSAAYQINQHGTGCIERIFTEGNITEGLVKFNDSDISRYMNIPSDITLEYKTVVEELMDKLNHSSNKKDYLYVLSDLTQKSKKIQKIEEQVANLNQEIDNILEKGNSIASIARLKRIDEIIQECDSLSDYDKEQIQNFKKFVELQSVLDNKMRLCIIIVLGIAGILLMISVIILIRLGRD